MRMEFRVFLWLIKTCTQVNLIHVDSCHLWWTWAPGCINLVTTFFASLWFLTKFWYSTRTCLIHSIYYTLILDIFSFVVVRRKLARHLSYSDFTLINLILIFFRNWLLFFNSFNLRRFFSILKFIQRIWIYGKADLIQIRRALKSFHAVLQGSLNLFQSSILLSYWYSTWT